MNRHLQAARIRRERERQRLERQKDVLRQEIARLERRLERSFEISVVRQLITHEERRALFHASCRARAKTSLHYVPPVSEYELAALRDTEARAAIIMLLAQEMGHALCGAMGEKWAPAVREAAEEARRRHDSHYHALQLEDPSIPQTQPLAPRPTR